MTGLASSLVPASSAIRVASSTLPASICREMLFPILTSRTLRIPRFCRPPMTALPCGSSNSFNGITFTCTEYVMLFYFCWGPWPVLGDQRYDNIKNEDHRHCQPPQKDRRHHRQNQQHQLRPV